MTPLDLDAAEALIPQLRLDSDEFGIVESGAASPGIDYSWDQGHVRLWEAAEQMAALVAEVKRLREEAAGFWSEAGRIARTYETGFAMVATTIAEEFEGYAAEASRGERRSAQGGV